MSDWPKDITEWADNDKDGMGDNMDPDDDNDGVTDNIDDFPCRQTGLVSKFLDLISCF